MKVAVIGHVEMAEFALVERVPEPGDIVHASETWELPAGEYEYKAALNGTWDENYGQGGVPGGANAALTLAADTIGRIILPPAEVQVGVMVALIGGPCAFQLHQHAVDREPI